MNRYDCTTARHHSDSCWDTSRSHQPTRAVAASPMSGVPIGDEPPRQI
jgi:hypothetical protein